MTIPVPAPKEQQVEKQEDPNISQEVIVKKTSRPLSKQGISSGFSISSFLNKEDKEDKEETVVTKTDHLPQNHFTETDLQMEWNLMLKQIQFKEAVIYNAVKSFKFIKTNENCIRVLYPSDSAKVEFDKISGEFFNHFKRKVQNYSVEIEFEKDVQSLKIEVVTKKKIFEKFIEKNPLLKDLDDLMKFDLS